MSIWKTRPSSLPLLLAAGVAIGGAAALQAENIDPGSDDHQFAWSENAGWINAEPAGDGGPGVEVQDFELVGWLWGENIGWVSLSCANTSSCADASFGVTNDGFGKLSGFAWGENVGWINFAPTACLPDPTCGVRIDPSTGYFGGRAWGENVGWVSFSSGVPLPSTARTSWCQSTVGPPAASVVLTLTKAGQRLDLTWNTPADASWYDVVRGSLSTLRTSGGDFAVSTGQCAAGKAVSGSLSLVEPAPPAGGDSWFLVRGSNCRGPGNYDTGAPSQAGTRDAEIAASGADCR